MRSTLLNFSRVSIPALKLGPVYLQAGLCHPEYSILSASMPKVPQWFMAVIMELLGAPGELEFIKAQVLSCTAGSEISLNLCKQQ